MTTKQIQEFRRGPFGQYLVQYRDNRRTYILDDGRCVTIWPGSIVCRRCGRILSSEHSLRDGLGPECREIIHGPHLDVYALRISTLENKLLISIADHPIALIPIINEVDEQ